MCFFWFESLPEPTSYSMDSLREFFGMSKANAHDALGDCKDTAMLLIRFLRLIRSISEKVKFKGSFGV